MSEEIKEAPAPEAPAGFDWNNIDPNTEEGRAAMELLLEQRLNAKAPKREKREIEINPNANAEKQPAVKIDREYLWQKRAVKYLNAATTLANSDNYEEKCAAQEQIAQLQTVTRSLSSFQIAEEEKEVDAIIAESGLSRRVQSRLHSTLTGPSGEFLLPKPFLAEVFTIIEEYGDVRRLFRMIPMVSKDLDLKNIATKPVVTWAGEAVRLTESDLTLGEQKITTNKLGAITSWSNEQQEDQAIALLPLYTREIGESLAQEEDESGLIGDGTSAYGGFTGVINYSGVVTTTMGSGDLAITDIAEADLRSMLKSLTKAKRRRGRWLLHYDVWDHIKTLENGSGYRIVQPTITDGGPMTLLGYPVEILEAMPNPSGDNASTILGAFVDPSRVLMGQRRGLSVETSRDAVLSDANGVVTFNSFQQDGQLLRITERIGFQCPTAHQGAIAVLKTAAS